MPIHRAQESVTFIWPGRYKYYENLCEEKVLYVEVSFLYVIATKMQRRACRESSHQIPI